MTTETKKSIISRYNSLLDKFFAAATITESDRIQNEMGRIFWHEVCKPGYCFVWSKSNRILDIIHRSAA